MSHNKHKSIGSAVQSTLDNGEKMPLAEIGREHVRTHFSLTGWFSHFAAKTADAVGSPTTFLLAILIVVVWGFRGPTFHYSDTWQLVINTGPTIVTFLLVFLLQNTQNRDA